jgi:hypothetical protein
VRACPPTRERRAAEKRRRYEQAKIGAEDQAQDVRHDQADEADHARHRHRGTDEQRRRHEDGPPNVLDVDAERRRTFLAGREQVQRRRVPHEHRSADGGIRSGDGDHSVALRRERAHDPEEHALRLLIARNRVHQHDDEAASALTTTPVRRSACGVVRRPCARPARHRRGGERAQESGEGDERRDRSTPSTSMAAPPRPRRR